MSLVTNTASNESHLLGAASDLTGLSYPFTVVFWFKYTHSLGWSASLGGIDDDGASGDNTITLKMSPTTGQLINGNQFGYQQHEHATTFADDQALRDEGWQLCYGEFNSGLNPVFYFNGVEESFTNGVDRDFISSPVGNIVPTVGKFNAGRCKIAHYAVFNRALTSGQKTELLTNTPDNISGGLPLVYKKLNTDAAAGIGSTFTDVNTDVTYDGADNPTLTEPTPVTPLFTAGPTVTSIGETTASVTGTSDENCTAQVVVVASGAGQPSDATFDASSFSVVVTADTQFSVNVTGLTGLTSYDAWVRLKPNVGTDTYASDAFTTTPAAPTITTVSAVVEGATVTVDGSGFTGHTAADINGTAQTSFNVVNDGQVTFTAVKPVNAKFGDSVTLNVGGTTTAITMAQKAGFNVVDMVSPLAAKEDRFDAEQTWDLAAGDQVEYENTDITINSDGTLILDEGATLPQNMLVSVFDSSDTTWGTEATIALVERPSANFIYSSISAVAATYTLSSNKTGTGYWRAYLATATPSHADIIAGTGAVSSGSLSVTAGLDSIATITGLSATTEYTFYAYVNDGTYNSSVQEDTQTTSVAVSTDFTINNILVEQYIDGVPYRTRRKPTIKTGALQSFKIENTKAQSSKGFVRIGLPFVKGDIPIGASPVVKLNGNPVVAQFDQRRTWPDKSLGFAVCTIRDTDFSASEERTYTVEATYNGYDNSSTKSLSDITSNTDFNLQVTNAVNSSAATYNGGSLSASFNTHAGVATRVTKTHSGPVCDEYEVWGMFDGTTEDAHLKSVWHVTAYKDELDNIVDYCYGAKICQDWWDVAGKDALTYDLELRNGATSIETYVGVEHPYHSHWVTVRKNNDDQYGRRHWAIESPSLHYKPDQVYFIKSGYVNSYDLSQKQAMLDSTNVYNSLYIPCENLNHRAAIDAGGGYMGRSSIPDSDIVAFVTGDKTLTRNARVNAFAGLHVPYHHKEHTNRVRPGETSDIANTILALDLTPKPQSYFDFTDKGMPAPKAMSRDYRSAVEDQAGWVDPAGGNGVWTISGDASHAVNYSYFMYILEGERYFMDATLDLSIMTAVQMPFNQYGNRPIGLHYGNNEYRQQLFNIPTDDWYHIAGLEIGLNTRAVGWSLNIMGPAYGTIPDEDIQAGFFKAFADHNLDWMAQSIDYLPQDQVDRGLFTYNVDTTSPWMLDFITLGGLTAHSLMKTEDSLKVAQLLAKFPAYYSSDPLIYMNNNYRGTFTQKKGAWHADTNTFIDYQYGYAIDCSTNSTNNTISTTASWTSGMSLSNGDTIKFVTEDPSSNPEVIPAGLVDGQEYYVIELSGTTFKISETLGGTEVNLTDDISCVIEMRPAIAATTPAVFADPYLPGQDSYARIRYAAMIAAREFDDTLIPQSRIDDYDAWLINGSFDTVFYWAYKGGQTV